MRRPNIVFLNELILRVRWNIVFARRQDLIDLATSFPTGGKFAFFITRESAQN